LRISGLVLRPISLTLPSGFDILFTLGRGGILRGKRVIKLENLNVSSTESPEYKDIGQWLILGNSILTFEGFYSPPFNIYVSVFSVPSVVKQFLKISLEIRAKK
jgi:hypothetical protein